MNNCKKKWIVFPLSLLVSFVFAQSPVKKSSKKVKELPDTAVIFQRNGFNDTVDIHMKGPRGERVFIDPSGKRYYLKKSQKIYVASKSMKAKPF